MTFLKSAEAKQSVFSMLSGFRGFMMISCGMISVIRVIYKN